ncbi:hypothetical protein WMF30_10250 [Sorangium sp. So ce134]
MAETVSETPRPLAGIPRAPDEYRDTSPRELITAEIENQCIDLRVRGRTYEQIATELGLGWNVVVAAIDRVLTRTRDRADARAEKAREIELRRCDAIIASFWERATDPNMAKVDVPADTETGVKAYDGQDKAADRLLKAMERRAKLLGLDAPATAVQVNVLQAPPVQEFAVAVATLLAALCPEHSDVVDAWLADVDRDVDGARSDPARWLERRRAVITVEPER